jgi:hypothetical protein
MIRELSSLDLELDPPVLLTSSVSVLLPSLTDRTVRPGSETRGENPILHSLALGQIQKSLQQLQLMSLLFHMWSAHRPRFTPHHCRTTQIQFSTTH